MTDDMHIQETAAPWRRRLPAILGLWAGGVAILGGLGAFAALPTAAIGVLAIAGIAAPVALYAARPGLRAHLAGLGLRGLTAFHLWRIGAAALFFEAGAEGRLPEIFVRHAAWGDLLAGLLVLPVLLLPERGRAKYWAFHTIGFADFLLAVGTGIALTLLGDPKMAAIAELPLVLIPLFGVGVSGASHIVAFHLLATRRG